MNSNRTFKKPSLPKNPNKRPGTPNNPNASVYISSSSTSIRRDLNETAPNFGSAFKKPILQSKKSDDDEYADLEVSFAYNEYLQSCMRKLIIQQDIKKKKEVLDGQLQHYEGVLIEKQGELNKILEDTQNVKKQQKVAELVNNLELVINKMKTLYDGCQMHVHLEKFRDILQDHCEKLFFKNVKPIKNQEDFDKLIEVMKTLLSTMDKFMSSGKDFDSVHEYAEAIRRFLENREKSDRAKEEALRIERESICKAISTLSDIFAKKYEKFDDKGSGDLNDRRDIKNSEETNKGGGDNNLQL